MAPGFCSSQTACPAQPFWEKFMAANEGHFHPSACTQHPSLCSQPRQLLHGPYVGSTFQKAEEETHGTPPAFLFLCLPAPMHGFQLHFFFSIEPEASGVQRTGSSLELDEEEKKKSQKKPPLAERCQQVAFSPRALPPPAVFSAAPTEIWPLCHFLGSRPPRRARSAAGEEGTAWQGPCSFPKSA